MLWYSSEHGVYRTYLSCNFCSIHNLTGNQNNLSYRFLSPLAAGPSYNEKTKNRRFNLELRSSKSAWYGITETDFFKNFSFSFFQLHTHTHRAIWLYNQGRRQLTSNCCMD